jgi:hypothetical protein
MVMDWHVYLSGNKEGELQQPVESLTYSAGFRVLDGNKPVAFT